VYPGYGYIQAGTIIDPPRAKQVADMMAAIAAELAEKGTNDDELLRAKQPILTSLRESARTNQYWLGNVVGRAQERPEMLDWCRSRYADFEAISVAEINALAKEYLGAGRASRVIVVPQPKAGPAAAEKKAE
jgi:zinc protease